MLSINLIIVMFCKIVNMEELAAYLTKIEHSIYLGPGDSESWGTPGFSETAEGFMRLMKQNYNKMIMRISNNWSSTTKLKKQKEE